jgi:ureidoacrylate peracid hydrolase
MSGLPAELIERAVYRRGRLAVFDRIVARRAALLVIDMQNAWLAPGAPFETQAARAIVPAINRLAMALRQRDGAVIWVQHATGRPGTPDYWSHYFDNFVAADKRAAAAAALVPGDPLHALWQDLDVQADDVRMTKCRFSLFARNPADPEAWLRARGIDTVIVAGTATNMCCESTVRDAMMRDLKTFMPFDAVAAPREDAHLAGLRSVMQSFADVRGVDDIIAIMD